MLKELPKAYEHTHEEGAYAQWESSGFFNPDHLLGTRKEPFTISMPPPNVTGSLHIGHAMFLTIEDLMTRYARMQGKRALWLPGVDHAAIATQNVVEKQIYKEEKKTRHDIGRGELVRRINEFVKGARHRIETQIRRMGSSCDWSRERYTLDPDLSTAVRTVFKQMYDDGLIYRGDRIVNWCPRCKSTLADDEVNYQEQKTKFYYFKYGPVVIGTARPETKFLDKTIVVHPKDKRYKDLVGRVFDVEWTTGKIQANVIADPVADMEFGTGAMTITPAHSFEDFTLAQKYKLPVVKIIDESGNLTDAAGEFAGRNAREAREEIVDILKKKGLVEKIDDNYVHNLSLCYRCGTPIEPLPSLQWFIAVDREFTIRNKELKQQFGKEKTTLKELSLWAVRSGEITIIPDRFNKIYFNWMENLHDWCISRQIWFGHQIPVWYCNSDVSRITYHVSNDQNPDTKYEIPNTKGKCDEPIVSIEEMNQCPHCHGEVTQDPDTLDTWFSSALWTFSTLGWPKTTKDFKAFHPTSVMETGYDILFFWVARMIIMTLYAVGDVPFRTIYLHGLVRDRQGRKMSKSLNNGIDPLDMIARFGTDPVRLSLVVGTTPGNDIRLYEEKIAGYRNFVNKLWNIGRFILTTVQTDKLARSVTLSKAEGSPANAGSHTRGIPRQARDDNPPEPKTLADEWILAELNAIIASTTKAMDEFRYSTAIENLYDFTWAKFADWYIEIAKFQRTQGLQESTDAILLYSLEQILKLWHPFTPFITEELWSHFNVIPTPPTVIPAKAGIQKQKTNKNNLLLIQPWPRCHPEPVEGQIIQQFNKLHDLITALRTFRAEHKVNPKEKLTGSIAVSKEFEAPLTDNLPLINHLSRTNLAMAKNVRQANIQLSGIQVSIDLSSAPFRDKGKRDDPRKSAAYIADLKKRLADPAFLSKAPPQVVEKERKRLQEMEKIVN